MSRYTYRLPQTTPDGIVEVSYGFDHATSFFFQAFDANEEVVLDLDSLFTGLTGVKLAEKLDEFGVPVPALHRNSMLADLQF